MPSKWLESTKSSWSLDQRCPQVCIPVSFFVLRKILSHCIRVSFPKRSLLYMCASRYYRSRKTTFWVRKCPNYIGWTVCGYTSVTKTCAVIKKVLLDIKNIQNINIEHLENNIMTKLNKKYFQDRFTQSLLGLLLADLLWSKSYFHDLCELVSPRCWILFAESNVRTERCVSCQNLVSKRNQKHFWCLLDQNTLILYLDQIGQNGTYSSYSFG